MNDYKMMAEYHRGYEDGRAARAADEWALHQKRMQALDRVTEYIATGEPSDDNPFCWMPTLSGAIHALLDVDKCCFGELLAGLSELLGADEDAKKPFMEYDVLDRDRADSREPEPAEGVAEEQRDKISPPKCMDGKVIHLGDFVVADDCNGHEVMGDVWEIKRCLLLNCWSINISTPAAFAFPSECRWFLETQVMRHATREEKAPIVSSLVQDGIVTDEWAEKQLKDESSQYYDALGNERHKAICELRKLADAIDDGQWVGMDDLADALGLGSWISNPVRKLLQLFAGDEYDSCVDVHSERHDDALSETIRNSNVYCAQPSATHELRAWVAKEVQPECWAKANALADRIDDDVKQATIDTRQNTYDSMCLEIDRLNTSMRNERQMYLDLLRDAARDYRSLQQADELRTHVLDAAIEENKNLRRMAEKLMEPDTPEHIVRDLTLGNISESDAIRRIEKLWEDAWAT